VSRNVTQGQNRGVELPNADAVPHRHRPHEDEVDTNVSESDIGGVKEGDKATFAVDAFPGRSSQAP